MSFLVVVTYDLHQADSDDYQCVKECLKKIGLLDTTANIRGDEENKLPNTTAAGQFDGVDIKTVKEDIRSKVLACMKKCGVKGKFFITVSDDWTWGTSKF